MPFLPSEGEETKVYINNQMKDVILFHYLPILWYRYPIPNEIREFWYKERPDILNYMQKAYKDLNIQFLPDSLLQELNEQKILSKLDLFDPNKIDNHLVSTELVFYSDMLLTNISKHFHL